MRKTDRATDSARTTARSDVYTSMIQTDQVKRQNELAVKDHFSKTGGVVIGHGILFILINNLLLAPYGLI